MGSNERYKLNSRWVAYQIMDDEAVIINLNSGSYYSLKDVGLDIWSWILDGATVGEVGEQIVQRYDADSDAVAPTVEQFVASLVREHLIVEADSARNGAGRKVAPVPARGTRAAFKAPSLERYDDVQGLLYLDPIHEVDETGWPSRR